MKLNDLIPNKSNPRFIKDEKFEKIKKSIQDFPKILSLTPIIIDDDNIILGCNMRYQALKELGFDELQEDWVKKESTLTEQEKKEFIVRDNVGFGDWGLDLLVNDWRYAEELNDRLLVKIRRVKNKS